MDDSKRKKRLVGGTLSVLIIIMLIVGSNLALLNMHINPLAGIKNLIDTAFSSDEINMINGNETESIIQKTSVEILDGNIVVCDSIVQGVRDAELPDGNYTFRVTGKASNGVEEAKDYLVELKNEYEDVTYSVATNGATVSLGDTTTEKKMLVVKYHKDLTIEAGVTVTAIRNGNYTYKKGMYLCVMGELVNKGTITMTARGTYNQAGENVYLWKNTDDTYEYVPATGGAGGSAVSITSKAKSTISSQGRAGGNGSNRALGGGGTGAVSIWRSVSGVVARTGAGGTATSYSGGAGSGGVFTANGANRTTITGYGAGANGGAGGAGYAYQSDNTQRNAAGGGAGNTGGMGQTTRNRSQANNSAYSGTNGTGGLLILYADTLYNEGTISSNGSNGGNAVTTENNRGAWSTAGGSSGGGSINIFARKVQSRGTQTATGGVMSGQNIRGGAGGNGTSTINELMPDLIYDVKTLELSINENYKIDKNKLQYINQNEKQTGILTVGDIEYETLDETIATVDSTGKIIGKAEGKTKIKITDTTNDISTYIYLQVINNVKIDLQEGKNFTVALKQNGTVWSYGLNTNGQLGNGNTDNQTEPVQVQGLNDVKQIATGYSHALALTKGGEIYAWGLGVNGQLGYGDINNSNVPVKVDINANIVKIDAYKNISVALDSEGKVHVWGEGYSTLPIKVVFSENIVDISGNLILTEKGQVYNLSITPTLVNGLYNIGKISCGVAHNLALSMNGTCYSWGTNTYGECGTTATGSISNREMAFDIYEISAGNQTSILQGDDGKVYVLGNNASGQIGISTTAKATALMQINLSEEETNIEAISAGEGTHSGIIDTNGFVWHAGTNTNGELSLTGNTVRNIFTKTGETVVRTNQEDMVYIDKEQSITIESTLLNTFNLKIGIIDDVQDHFEIELTNSTIVEVQGRTLIGKEYGKTTVIVRHIETGITGQFDLQIVAQMESIVQGFRDLELPDGEYEVLVKDQKYTVELKNEYNDVTYSLEDGLATRKVSLGDDSNEYKTLVVKYHGNLTIDEGVTVTANTYSNGLTYKKGMYLCVMGELVNKGTITMTARGTYNQAGENVYLWKNTDDTYEYVPATGGAGGSAVSITSKAKSTISSQGRAGGNGSNRALGGGGTGAVSIWRSVSGVVARTGAGGTATSYSGGAGSGGVFTANGANRTTITGYGAGANGGAGGAGYAYQSDNTQRNAAGGGAGNTGGMGQTTRNRSQANNSAYSGTNGTGGLLILYADTLYNEGTISSNGSNGGNAVTTENNRGAWSTAGGSSGGGSINIFARKVQSRGTQTATGGVMSGQNIRGGAGGNGSITINEVGSVLNYADKRITLNLQDTYTIDKNKLSYTKLDQVQTEDVVMGGTINYEVTSGDNIIVDSSGRITPKTLGRARVKITDEDNGYSTYIVVEVIDNGSTKSMVKEGNEFTLALKENGTVWTYGNNGINTTNEPVEIMIGENELKDIIDIGAGNKISIALNKAGEVYTWGTYKTLNGDQVENEPQKVEGIQDIINVDAFGNNFYGLDSNGVVYIWGEGYIEPTIIETTEKIIDIDGKILLGENGLVYNVSSPQDRILYLSDISTISSGDSHYLFTASDGYVHSLGTGDLGQLGSGKTVNYTFPVLVRTEEGYLEDVYEASGGTKTSIAVTMEGKAYVFGDNTNKKLGVEGSKITYATEITKIYSEKGIEVELKDIESVETGNTHSTITDVNGFVYSVGLNTKGQLGTGDNTARAVFTRIGYEDIITDPEEINIKVGTTKDIAISLSNTFNLKTDIVDGAELDSLSTNEKEIEITKIAGVKNEHIKNIKDFAKNYKITGRKIGRVDVVVTAEGGVKKNIWINVVDAEESEVSAKVVNGDKFTIALRADGTVWGFGSINGKNNPEKYELPEKIIDITAGKDHAILLGKSGKIYTFGTNGNGQLGTGNTTTYKTPTKLNLSEIKKVTATENTSFAITSEGKVYAWGSGIRQITSFIKHGQKCNRYWKNILFSRRWNSKKNIK